MNALLFCSCLLFVHLSHSTTAINWVPCPVFSQYTQLPAKDIRINNTQAKGLDDDDSIEAKLRWLETHDQEFLFPKENLKAETTSTATCALFAVPLSYSFGSNSSDSNKTINIFVKRVLRNPPSVSNKIVFLIQGGPGASAEAMEGIFYSDTNHIAYPDHDVYVIDHRGTGRSNFVGCVDESNLTECAFKVNELYGDAGFDSFSPTGFAKDLEIILTQIENEEGKKNITLYGVSYGTRAVYRFLTIFPNRVANAILTGVVAPPLSFGSSFSINHQNVAIKVLEKFCGEDSNCTSAMECSPVESFMNTMEAIKNGSNTCLSKLKYGSSIKYPTLFIANQISVQSPTARRYLPYSSSRLRRCSSSDITELNVMFQEFIDMLTYKPVLIQNQNFYDLPYVYTKSDFVYTNIAAAELNSGETYEEFLNATENVYFGSRSKSGYFESLATWPRNYSDVDNYVFEKCTNSTTNVLILNGNMDGQTPDFMAWNLFYNYFVSHQGSMSIQIFNYGPHAVLNQNKALYNINSTTTASCSVNITADWYDVNNSGCDIDSFCLPLLNPDVIANGSYSSFENIGCDIMKITYPVGENCYDPKNAVASSNASSSSILFALVFFLFIHLF